MFCKGSLSRVRRGDRLNRLIAKKWRHSVKRSRNPWTVNTSGDMIARVRPLTHCCVASAPLAGVAQLVEYLPSKQGVAGSSPVSRSIRGIAWADAPQKELVLSRSTTRYQNSREMGSKLPQIARVFFVSSPCLLPVCKAHQWASDSVNQRVTVRQSAAAQEALAQLPEPLAQS